MSAFEHLAELLVRTKMRQSSPGQSGKPLEDQMRPLPGVSSAVCSVCKGAGRVRRDVPFGHPDFGKDFACVCQERELHKQRTRKMIALCEAFGLQRQQRLSTFQGQIKGAQEAFDLTRGMIEGLEAWARQREGATEREERSPRPPAWLVLLGPVGTGKTHLAMAIANACIDAGIMTLFATLPALLDDLRATYAAEAEVDYYDWFTQMRQAEVVVLDDVGTQHHSDWADEKVFQMINARYTAGLPTVITLTREGWTSLDERIRSRVQHVGLLVSLEQAQDYRVRKSQPGE